MQGNITIDPVEGIYRRWFGYVTGMRGKEKCMQIFGEEI
jgi:hypothetical protein